MKRLSHIVLLLLFLISSHAYSGSAKNYTVYIEFQRKGYTKGKKELLHKWRRTVEYREDFHFFLDRIPLRDGFNVGSIAGVIYPKNGSLHCTLQLWASRELKSEVAGNIYSIGEVKFFKLPKSLKFDLPLTEGSLFQKCTVTLTPK